MVICNYIPLNKYLHTIHCINIVCLNIWPFMWYFLYLLTMILLIWCSPFNLGVIFFSSKIKLYSICYSKKHYVTLEAWKKLIDIQIQWKTLLFFFWFPFIKCSAIVRGLTHIKCLYRMVLMLPKLYSFVNIFWEHKKVSWIGECIGSTSHSVLYFNSMIPYVPW